MCSHHWSFAVPSFSSTAGGQEGSRRCAVSVQYEVDKQHDIRHSGPGGGRSSSKSHCRGQWGLGHFISSSAVHASTAKRVLVIPNHFVVPHTNTCPHSHRHANTRTHTRAGACRHLPPQRLRRRRGAGRVQGSRAGHADIGCQGEGTATTKHSAWRAVQQRVSCGRPHRSRRCRCDDVPGHTEEARDSDRGGRLLRPGLRAGDYRWCELRSTVVCLLRCSDSAGYGC